VVTSSSVSSRNFWGPNTLTLGKQQYFVRDTACQSTKWQVMEEIFGGMATLASFDYIYGSKIG